MAEHVLSGLAIDAPVSEEAIAALQYTHGFITKPFTGSTPVDDFNSGAQEWGGLILGAFLVERTRDANTVTLLNGQTITTDSPVTVPSQTVRILTRLGSAPYTIIQNYDYTLPDASNSGEWMAFARKYPDGNALIGQTRIEGHTPEGDPEADNFGYDVTWAFRNVRYHDGRANLNPPTYTSAGSSTTGAAGAAQTVNGTNLLNVQRVQYRTSGGVLVSTVQSSAFSTRTDSQIILTPSGLQAATAYSRLLVHQNGEVSAGTYTTS